MFAGGASDAPLVLAGSFGGYDAIQLVRVPSDGEAEIVGELKSSGDDEEDPRVLSLLWHAPTATLKVLTATHVSDWGPPKRG